MSLSFKAGGLHGFGRHQCSENVGVITDFGRVYSANCAYHMEPQHRTGRYADSYMAVDSRISCNSDLGLSLSLSYMEP